MGGGPGSAARSHRLVSWRAGGCRLWARVLAAAVAVAVARRVFLWSSAVPGAMSPAGRQAPSEKDQEQRNSRRDTAHTSPAPFPLRLSARTLGVHIRGSAVGVMLTCPR